MIASYENKLIFLKTYKTGGTSVEIVLSAACGANDICTTITAEDEIVRYNYGGAPRNFCRSTWLENRYRRAIAGKNVEKIRRIRKKTKKIALFRSHMSGARVRKLLPDLWNAAYKFTVERHPYEQTLSRAYYLKNRNPNNNLYDKDISYMLDKVIEEAESNKSIYCEDGQILVDEIIRYEQMWPRISQLFGRHGLQLPKDLPNAKATHRTTKAPAIDILTQAQKNRIRNAYDFEFNLMNYDD